MSMAQGNFERALKSGQMSLNTLADAARTQYPPNLGTMHARKLRALAWDLEAIQAAIRLELNDRETQKPVDFG